MHTLICLLAVNAFLLMAIFGMLVVRYVERLENAPPKDPWYVRYTQSALSFLFHPTIESCRFLDDERVRMEVTLTDGSVWAGHDNWWWNPATGSNAPAYVQQLLSRSRVPETV